MARRSDAKLKALISETRAGLTAGLAFLGSPGTVHLRPDAARVAASKKRLPPWQKLLVAAGVLKRQDDGRLYDGLLNLQGPNYALAKHMHMWRAAVARHQDHVVSCPMAPAVRTRSMVKVPAVASALRGGPYFGTHSYDPAFTSAIMALLLIAHVTDPKSRHAAPVPAHVPDKPMEAFALDGFTGGLWTSPFTPDSTAKPAALLGATALAQPVGRHLESRLKESGGGSRDVGGGDPRALSGRVRGGELLDRVRLRRRAPVDQPGQQLLARKR